MDDYDEWEELPNIAGVNDAGRSQIFTVDNTSDSTNKSIKSDFGIGKRQS